MQADGLIERLDVGDEVQRQAAKLAGTEDPRTAIEPRMIEIRPELKRLDIPLQRGRIEQPSVPEWVKQNTRGN